MTISPQFVAKSFIRFQFHTTSNSNNHTSFKMPETPLTPTEHNFLQGSQINRDGDTEGEIVDHRDEVS